MATSVSQSEYMAHPIPAFLCMCLSFLHFRLFSLGQSQSPAVHGRKKYGEVCVGDTLTYPSTSGSGVSGYPLPSLSDLICSQIQPQPGTCSLRLSSIEPALVCL